MSTNTHKSAKVVRYYLISDYSELKYPSKEVSLNEWKDLEKSPLSRLINLKEKIEAEILKRLETLGS